MSSTDGIEPERKRAPDMSDTSLTPPITYTQLTSVSSLRKSSAHQSPKSPVIKKEGTSATQSPKGVYSAKEQDEPKKRTNNITQQQSTEDSRSTNASNNPSPKSSSGNQSQDDNESSGESIRNKVLATIQGTLNKSMGLQVQATSSETSPTQEPSGTSEENRAIDQSFMEEPQAICTEPISIIINYIEKNCDKIEEYLLGVGDRSFIGVFSAIMKSFYETGFVSLKQLSMYRAKAPEFFSKLSHFLMQMGLEYVNQMNKQNDTTPQNSYSAAYIVACAMECMNETQHKQYIYQLRRDSSNRLRQRRGFNKKRVELSKLSQKSPHGISHCSFFQHNFQEKVINLRG